MSRSSLRARSAPKRSLTSATSTNITSVTKWRRRSWSRRKKLTDKMKTVINCRLFACVAVLIFSAAVCAQIEQDDQRVSALFQHDGFRIPEVSRRFDKQVKIEKLGSFSSDGDTDQAAVKSTLNIAKAR